MLAPSARTASERRRQPGTPRSSRARTRNAAAGHDARRRPAAPTAGRTLGAPPRQPARRRRDRRRSRRSDLARARRRRPAVQRTRDGGPHGRASHPDYGPTDDEDSAVQAAWPDHQTTAVKTSYASSPTTAPADQQPPPATPRSTPPATQRAPQDPHTTAAPRTHNNVREPATTPCHTTRTVTLIAGLFWEYRQRDSNPRPSGYEPIVGVSWGVAGSDDLALLLEMRLTADLPTSWNGVEHVCTLFALGGRPLVGHVRGTDGCCPTPIPSALDLSGESGSR